MEADLQHNPSVLVDDGISKTRYKIHKKYAFALKAMDAPPPVVLFIQTDPDRIYCVNALS